LKWLFAALFAPEIVVFTAFQQWLTAKLFLKELIKISDAKACKDLEVGLLFTYIHNFLTRKYRVEKVLN